MLFIQDVRKIISIGGGFMGFKVNLHLTDACNFDCRYCFAEYEHSSISFLDWKCVLDNLYASGMVSAVNLAGGEPFLYPYFTTVLAYAHELGFDVSVISNGTVMDDRIGLAVSEAGKLRCIGVSIDSLNPLTCRMIGRCRKTDDSTLDFSALESFFADCYKVNSDIRFKVNTVVSTWNKDEILGSFFGSFGQRFGFCIDRWKLLRVMPFAGKDFYCVSYDDFFAFATKNKEALQRIGSRTELVVEPSLRDAYIIVDQGGNLIGYTDNGTYLSYGSLLDVPFEKLIRKYPLDVDMYNSHSF